MFVLLLSLAVSISSFANSNPPKKTCEVLLEVFDSGVNPPFAHGQKLIEYIDEHNSHKILSRDGATFRIETSSPDAILRFAGRGDIAIVRAEKEGVSTSLYEYEASSEAIYPETQDLMRAIGILREGLYWLEEKNTGKPATMFVKYVLRDKPGFFSGGLVLNVDLWPEHVRFVPGENYYRQKSLGSFSNGEDADGYRVVFKDDHLTLSYSLPYELGKDSLKLKLHPTLPFENITTQNGKTYELRHFFRLKQRAK